MDQGDEIYQLGVQALEFRKQAGFLKGLPKVIRQEAARLANSGASLKVIAKSLGVSRNTIADWKKRYCEGEPDPVESAGFSEVKVVEERPIFEVKLTGKIQGCRVELTGSDFSQLHRLMRKLGS